MRRSATVTVLGGALIALLIFVPRWTAAKAEAARKAALDKAISRGIPPNLPLCPLPGPRRDLFLKRSAAALKGSHNLWFPVCRVAPLPAHHIVISAKTREELSGCNAGSVWRPSNVICALEERLGFLADAKAPRTWARRERGDFIWMTSEPMAWQDHLISEHRQWMTLWLALFATSGVLGCGVQRTRRAIAWRAACHGAGEPDAPRNAELLLHWMLGERCRSLPGDLSEEYAWKLDNGFSRKEADVWYCWQVFHSIAPVAARSVESIMTRGLRRGLFTRRG